MANNPSNLIKFKRGSWTALQSKISQKTGEDGCFYLTIDNNADSSRLFVGRADGSIVPVNQGIITVANTDALSALTGNFQAGDFAYVTDGNILAVRSGSGWVQINTVVDTKVEDFSDEITVSNGVATITSTLEQDNGQSDIVSSFLVAGSNGITISSTDGATAADPDTLVINGEHYSISREAAANNGAAIALTSDKQNSAAHDRDSSITIKGGDNVTVSTPNAGEIQIAAADNYVNGATVVGQTAASGNGFKLTLERTGNLADVPVTFDPQIKVGIDSTKQQTLHFVGDNSAASALATLPVYTSAEVDEKLIAVNAMIYKGVVGGTGNPALSDITTAQVGDTYKVAANNAVSVDGGTTYLKAGDVIIANGTEGANGNISGTITWDVIPSGDEIYDYTIEPATHGFTLEEGNTANKGGFSLAAGTNNLITLTDSADGNGDRIVTLEHSNVTRNDTNAPAANDASDDRGSATAAQTNGNDLSFWVVDSLTSSAQGHVTAANYKKVTVKDSTATVSTVDHGVEAANNVATITTTVGITPYNNATESTDHGTFTLTSSNLTVSNPNNTDQVKMDFCWESFED